jgi:hypothetical protein
MGSLETLDNTHLMRLAGRFSRRVRGWAKAHGVPVIDCRAGERKHDLAEEYLKATPIKRGVFLILVRKAQVPVWEVSVRGKNITWNERSRCLMGIMIPFIVWILPGAT